MARQPHELAHQDPNVLGPRRDLDVEQIFYSEYVAVLVVHVGEVVQPVGQGDDGRVHAVLGDLLLAAVQVAHHGVAPDDGLAVELQDEPQEAVHGRVLRAHVHVYGFEAELVAHVRGGEATGGRLGQRALLFGATFFAKHLSTSVLRRCAWS